MTKHSVLHNPPRPLLLYTELTEFFKIETYLPKWGERAWLQLAPSQKIRYLTCSKSNFVFCIRTTIVVFGRINGFLFCNTHFLSAMSSCYDIVSLLGTDVWIIVLWLLWTGRCVLIDVLYEVNLCKAIGSITELCETRLTEYVLVRACLFSVFIFAIVPLVLYSAC